MHTPTHYRRYLLSVLFASLGLLVLPAVFVLVVDPLQIYHKHWLTEVRFLPQERFQNAGLINNYLADDGVDSLIVGTSVSQNFLASKVEKEMGWGKTLRLTLSAGTPRELRITLEHALKKGGVRHVMWEIYTPYTKLNTHEMNEENLFPAYLYNESWFDDAHYLFNNDAVEMSTKVIRGAYDDDLDTFSYWMDRAVAAGAFKTFNAPKSRRELAQNLALRRATNDRYEGRAPSTNFPNIDVNVFEVVKAHPEVEFTLYIPPLSTLNYALMQPPGFVRALSMRRYIVEQAARHPNVRLYAFDDVAWICTDMKNYKDQVHYGVTINDYMVRAFKAGKHRLTPATIDAYEATFMNLVRTYALEEK